MLEAKSHKMIALFNVRDRCDRQVQAYASSEPLTVSNVFSAYVEVKNAAKPKVFAEFFVVNGANRSLLSHDTSKRMKLLQVGLSVYALEIAGNIPKPFPKIPGYQLSFNINKDVEPIRHYYYNVPLAMETSVNQRLMELQARDIIEDAPGSPRWLSGMGIVKKGDGDYRIVINMRGPNTAILREPYPLPSVEKLTPQLAGMKFFTKLDIKSAYHHVELDENSRDITTFMTSSGPKRYKRLMFGVNCAPEIFQKLMEEAIKGCDGVIVYIDDILIFAMSLEELQQRTQRVLKALREKNLTLNVEKCIFDQEEVTFLGHVVNGNGVRPVNSKIEAVSNFRKPASKAELHSFLGLATYLSPFIADFATLSEPLRRLLKKNCAEHWSAAQDEAFERIKRAVVKDVETRGFFNEDHKTFLYSDASPVGLGAVLVQEDHDGVRHVIAYASKALTDTERKYPQTQREALALVWATERFQYFLLGRKFTAYVDHKPLEFIFKGKFNDGKRAITRAQGWALRLGAYQYDVEYVRGVDNIADPLSRMVKQQPIPFDESNRPHEFQIATLELNALVENECAISLQLIREATQSDQQLQRVKLAAESGEWTPELSRFQALSQELSFKQDLVLRDDRLVIPVSLRARVMKIVHRGHPGIVSMKRTIRAKMWWPGLDKDVENLVKSCLGCTTVSRNEPPEPMIRTEMPSEPWELLAIDFYSTDEIEKKFLVVIDYYSRFLAVSALNTNNAQLTTDALDVLFMNYGNPGKIKADNGSPFQSAEFQKWCIARDIKLIHSIPAWPRMNGEVERQMQGITKALSIAKNVDDVPWREALKEYVKSYNLRPHSVTGEAPMDLLLCRRVRGNLPFLKSSSKNLCDEEIRDRDAESKMKGKHYQDKRQRAKWAETKEGDFVLIRSTAKGKLRPRFIPDPCEVLSEQKGEIRLKTPAGNVIARNVTDVKKVEKRALEPTTIERSDSDNAQKECNQSQYFRENFSLSLVLIFF